MVKEKEIAKKAASTKAAAKKKTSPKKEVAPKSAPKKSVSKEVESKKDATVRVVSTPVTTGRVAAPKSEAVTVVKTHAAPKEKKAVVNNSIYGVGRRKSSVARAWLTRGNGAVSVNGKAVELYFKTSETSVNAIKPLIIAGAKSLYNVNVNVQGGGPNSQSDAVKLGIARALIVHNDAYRGVLKQNGLLTVDSRVKERKKPGQKGARRKFQFVKR